MKLRRHIRALKRDLRAKSHLDYFPLRPALRRYDRKTARADLKAAINVALMAIPQAMAYAAIAGLPMEYALYGSAVAAILGPIWGGSRFIIMGPTNATAVLVFASFLSLELVNPAERAAVLPIIVLLGGVFLVFGAFLKVANLIQYISRSVVTGYLTAAAIFMIANQLKHALGVEYPAELASTLLGIVYETVRHLPQIHLPTVFLALATGLWHFWAGRRWPKLPHVAISLVLFSGVGTLLQWLLTRLELGALHFLSPVKAGDWSFTLPQLDGEWVGNLGGVALIIAFLGILEGTSIGKTLAARSGEKLNANQEMLGMGMANIGCAFLGGVPASGSLVRSQLNWTSGARTALASVFCGLICVALILLAGPLVGHVPTAVLATLVILTGWGLINRAVLRVVWNATTSDRTVFLTTFVAALLVRLDFAIILGAGVSILLFLRKAAQPELIEYTQDAGGQFKPLDKGEVERVPEISIVHVEGDLFFGAAELFRDQMRRACEKPHLQIVVLKLRNAHHLDATSVLALEELVRYMRETGRHLLVSEARKDAIRIFRNSGLIDSIGRDNIFPDHAHNPTLSTSRAIRRAMKILNGREAEVKIFVGASKKREPGAE